MTVTVYQHGIILLDGDEPSDDAWIWTVKHQGTWCVVAGVPDRVARWKLGVVLGELHDADSFTELTSQVDLEVIPVLRGAARRLGIE